jgi:EAL and modified HD-GYP domain-containing signal transduction protein
MSDSCLARQPVFSSAGALIGYDIRFSETDDQNQAFAQSVLSGAFDLVRNRLPGFVSATRTQLLEDAFLMAAPGAVVAMLPPTLELDGDVEAAIRRYLDAGGHLALELVGETPAAVDRLAGRCTWIRVEVATDDASRLAATCRRILEGLSAPKPKLIASNVADLSQYEAALTQGFDGFHGVFFSRPEPLPTAQLPQSTVAALRLLGMARDPSVTDPELEEVIATDPVLTFQLLRLVNSAAIGARGVSSLGQALRLIGRTAFLRWLAVAIASARSNQSGVDRELVRQAVERGRFLEQLAGGGRDPGTLFLVGLFSLLDAVFRMTMADLLGRVELSTDSTDALLHRTGPYADALTFAESYELGLFENAEALADDMGIDVGRIGEYYTNAVRWTSEAMTAIHEGPGR